MTTREEPRSGEAREIDARRAGMLGAAGGVVLGAGLVAIVLRTVLAPAPDAPPPVVRATPSVITAVRELARLEGATAHVERITEITDNQADVLGIPTLGLVTPTDTLLLVAAADVTAGVDLAALEPSSIVVDEATDTVTITLPRSTVLTTALDEEHTYVHSRSTDLLADRREDLETLARRDASTRLEAAAVEGGILDRSDASVARTVEALVRSLGHEHVTVRRAGE